MSKDNSRLPDKSASELMNKSNVKAFPGSEPSEIIVRNLSTIKPKKIEWIWQDLIAIEKITLLAGEPGVGKSQLLLYITHILSTGGTFHYEKNPIEPKKVLLVAGEDKMNDTVIPRLSALGANINNIDFMEGIRKKDKKGREYFDPISLAENISEIEDLIIEHQYKVIIIDPISIYLGSADENKNKDIRSILAQLTAVCERRGIAVIINSHFTKPSGSITKNAIYRVMGSIGFAAAARIVYGVMKDPEDTARRLLIPIKNNIAQDELGFVYNIKLVDIQYEDFSVTVGKVEWLNERITQSANEILNPSQERGTPKLKEAKEFLLDILKSGCVSLTVIRKTAEEKGISKDRLYAAKDELNINEEWSSDRKRGKIWMLAP